MTNMAKPKVTIKNFSGMGGGGVHYLESMVPQDINGKKILTPAWYCTDHIDEDTTGFSSYITTMHDLVQMDWDGNNSTYDDRMVGVEGGNIYDIDVATATNSEGKIHDNGTTDGKIPAVHRTKDNNILYTSAQYLGIGRTFVATGGSTTTIVDAAADFSALGYAAGDKLYNFTNGEEYTIDAGGVGTTTLTLVSGTANNADDVFVVFDDNFQDLGTGGDFTGQFGYATWYRQIKLFEDSYYILNGNYLASLNVDESTFSASTKLLPYQTNAICFDVNQGRMLIGGDYFGKGRLLLWDGYSDGWLSQLNIPITPDAIKAYKSGWIVVVGATIYYTDGYQLQVLSTVPDLDPYDRANCHHNGIEVIDEDIIMNLDPNERNRAKSGIWIYNPKYGWSYTPLISTNGYQLFNSGAGAIGLHTNVNTSSTPYTVTRNLMACTSTGEATSTNLINKISYNANKYSAIFYINLPYKMRISEIELNISPKYNEVAQTSGTYNVTVNYGDGKDLLWDLGEVAAGSDTDTIVNSKGSSYPAKVGSEIRLLEGDYAGARSWITSITNAGETNETWEISPAFAGTPSTGTDINIMRLFKSETKAITSGNIESNTTFNVSDFYSDKLWLEVVFELSTGQIQLDLHSINIS